MFALVDCNSCYASCEQIFRPDLRGKPVVVLTNNDGCIVARSKEAKALGIPDLEPYFKVRHLLEQHRVQVFSSNYELYGDISARVMAVLGQFAPEVDIYSIDEAFLAMDGITEDFVRYARRIRNSVWQQVRMPVSVGIAPTRTLAKLANHIAKQSARCDGVCVIRQPQDWFAVMQKIPVRKVWGVGSRYARRLAGQQVFSVYDLLTQDPDHIRHCFNIGLARTVRELRGQSCIAPDDLAVPKKQIYTTRSFGQRVFHCEELEQSISQYAGRACEKLRAQHSLVKTLSIFIETSRFDPNPLHLACTVPLYCPTNDTRTVVRAARAAVRGLYREGYAYAKAGIGLIELLDEKPEQTHLFEAQQSESSRQLMAVMDKINQYGSGEVFLASHGIQQRWAMQRQFRSPSYTTRWGDIPGIKMR
ncbi:MAG: Y-family DNA polymerase [Pseudomonadales bacterium]|nr:Y-family DNA polymerase [Pseudomonadales bacterium]